MLAELFNQKPCARAAVGQCSRGYLLCFHSGDGPFNAGERRTAASTCWMASITTSGFSN